MSVRVVSSFLSMEFLTSQVLRLDITPMVPPTSPTHSASSAQLILFSPRAVDHLLVVTSSGESSSAGLLKFNASNGQLLSEVQDTLLSLEREGAIFDIVKVSVVVVLHD